MTDLELDHLKDRYDKATSDAARELCLYGVLFRCGSVRPLPEWAVEAFVRMLVRRDQDREDIHGKRYTYVVMLLDLGVKHDDVFQAASRFLQGTPAEGGEEAMRRSYKKHRLSLPPDQRRKRTWRAPTERPAWLQD